MKTAAGRGDVEGSPRFALRVLNPDERVGGFGILRVFKAIAKQIEDIRSECLPQAVLVLLIRSVNLQEEVPQNVSGFALADQTALIA